MYTRKFFSSLRLLLLTFLVTSPLSSANEEKELDLVQVAKSYLSFYGKGEIEPLGSYLTANARFSDPSMDVTGKDKIIDSLKQVFSSISNMKFDVENSYVSGQTNYITQGKVYFDIKGAALGLEKKLFHIKMPMIIVLDIKQGKIVEHIDYMDSKLFNLQIQEQMSQG